MLSLDGPVLIKTTKTIRKRSPIVCPVGDQGAHLVGLNLLKKIVNYYSVERDIVLRDPVIDQLVRDINDKSNFECETPEQNAEDRHVEQEVLNLLFHSKITYEEMSDAAKLMFQRLRELLQTMVINLSSRGESVTELTLIRDEIDAGQFPLQRHCLECRLSCLLIEQTSFNAFCDITCQEIHYDGEKSG